MVSLIDCIDSNAEPTQSLPLAVPATLACSVSVPFFGGNGNVPDSATPEHGCRRHRGWVLWKVRRHRGGTANAGICGGICWAESYEAHAGMAGGCLWYLAEFAVDVVTGRGLPLEIFYIRRGVMPTPGLDDLAIGRCGVEADRAAVFAADHKVPTRHSLVEQRMPDTSATRAHPLTIMYGEVPLASETDTATPDDGVQSLVIHAVQHPLP